MTQGDTHSDGMLDRSGKPWLRRRNVFIACSLLLLILAPFAYRGYRLSRVGLAPEPFDLAAFRASTIPAGEDAFDLFSRAASKLATRPSTGDLPGSLANHWNDVDQQHKDFLTANVDVVSLWKQGSVKSRFRESDPNLVVYTTTIPITGEARRAIALCVLDGIRQQHEGDLDAAFQSYRAGYRSSLLMGQDSFWMGRLVGISGQSLAIEYGLLPYLHDPALDAQNILSAGQLLREDRQTLDRPVSQTLKFEHIAFENEMDRWPNPEFFKLIGSGGASSSILGLPPAVLDTGCYFVGEPEIMKSLYRYVAANLLTQCDLPRYQRKVAPVSKPDYLFDLDRTADGTPIMPPELIAKRLPESWFAPLLTFSNNHLMKVADEGQARQQLLEVVIALELHQRRHGDFPQSLSELSDEFPVDLTDNLTGNQFLYRRAADGNATVYSAGINGIDDHGTDWAFEKNLDLGYQLPPPGQTRSQDLADQQ